MPTSTTIRTAIIIITMAMFGSTPSGKRDHGWICREATIPGKFTTGVRGTKGAITTTDRREIMGTIMTIGSTTENRGGAMQRQLRSIIGYSIRATDGDFGKLLK